MKIKLFFILICFSVSAIAQQQKMSKESMQILQQKKRLKIDSIKKLNLIDRKYRYLDDNFKINIPKDTFDAAIEKYKFIKPRIRRYKDSLSVVLTQELKDMDVSRIATLEIGYTWLRLAYHLWLTEKETQLLGEKLGFNHPYRLKKFIVNDDDSSKERKQIITNLKNRMKKENSYQLDTFPSTHKLLNFALRKNPVRDRAFKKQFDKFHKKHK